MVVRFDVQPYMIDVFGHGLAESCSDQPSIPFASGGRMSGDVPQSCHPVLLGIDVNPGNADQLSIFPDTEILVGFQHS